MRMNWLDKLAWVLIVLGGLNWGAVGFFKYNAVDKIFTAGTTSSKVVYDIIGVAAIWAVVGMVMAWSSKK